LSNKFYGHFAAFLEYVISLIADLLGAFVYWIIFIWHWQLNNRTCALHAVELYRFHTCGLWWGSEVSPSMDRPPRTVCHLHYEHQSCRRMLSYVLCRRTSSRLLGTVETCLHDSGVKCKCTNWLTCCSRQVSIMTVHDWQLLQQMYNVYVWCRCSNSRSNFTL